MAHSTDRFQLPSGFTVISGGQTGADRAGLDWAIANGVKHGGWCPKGRRAEDGPIDERYQLVETEKPNYVDRTRRNVRDSDATLIFTMGEELTGGSKRTAEFARQLEKPWLHFRPGVAPKYITRFLLKHHVKTLNVAGQRESSAPGIGDLVRGALGQALTGSGEGGPLHTVSESDLAGNCVLQPASKG